MMRAFLCGSIFAAALLVACSSGSGSAPGGGSGGGSSGSGGSGGAAPSCAQVCPNVLAAQCSGGPSSESDCESGCQAVRSGACGSQYEALLSCGGSDPQFGCNPAGSVIVVGCDAQNTALSQCLGTP